MQVQKPQHVIFMLKYDNFPLRGAPCPTLPYETNYMFVKEEEDRSERCWIAPQTTCRRKDCQGIKRKTVKWRHLTYTWERIRKKKINCISSPNCYDLLHDRFFTPLHFLTLHVLQHACECCTTTRHRVVTVSL